MLDRKRIGEILVELGVLSAAEVQRVLDALKRRGGSAKFGQVAANMGLARQEHILAALAVQLELLPRAADMSLSRLLGHLGDPNGGTLPTPVRKAPRRIASSSSR